ncbi:hypothetical protein SAMN05421780_101390 [Flexibacter flexilis DSM 6793]|uniref:Uncharacterized protein n=1 Tax=Flexibacter flexilis DSM 6793 TaxID=927664 RepID=A0A1I1DRC9_9BACT|nr:hypothetical protein SAMN05421780_101390 [Flexibacter flexilis DSM 6793]
MCADRLFTENVKLTNVIIYLIILTTVYRKSGNIL